MVTTNARKHEVAFCADVSKWADKLFDSDLSLPFGSSDIDELRARKHEATGLPRLRTEGARTRKAGALR